MKASRRNIRNATHRAEQRSSGPPVQSRYARKIGKAVDVHTSPQVVQAPGIVFANGNRDDDWQCTFCGKWNRAAQHVCPNCD